MPAHRWVAGLAVVILIPILSSQALAQASDMIGGHVKQWWPEVSGTVRGSSNTIKGTNIDVTDDLNLLRENSGVTDFAVWGKFPMIPFRVMFSTYGGGINDGKILENPVAFEGHTYPAGGAIAGDLTLRAYTLMLDFGVGTPTLYQSNIRFGVQIGMQWMAHEIDIDSAGFSDDERWETAIPMLGVHASVRLGGLFEIFALLQGIQTFGITEQFDGGYLDLNVELRWWATPGFAFGFGYRFLKIDGMDDEDDHLNVTLKGLYVSVVFQY